MASSLPSIDEIVRDIAIHRLRNHIMQNIPRDELRLKIMRYYDKHSNVEINSTREEHKQAEEFIRQVKEERQVHSQDLQDYSPHLTPHPQQRIYKGNEIL